MQQAAIKRRKASLIKRRGKTSWRLIAKGKRALVQKGK